MSSVFKRLAGQTAVYGLSNIVGRLLNYFLVPLYTHLFTQAQYGTVTEFYAYSSFLFVVFTYGMETAYFRFATVREDKREVFDTSIVSLWVSSIVLCVLLFIFAQPLSSYLGYADKTYYIKWFAIIMAADALSAIPFARLRLENKPMKYVLFKMLNIGFTIGLNLFLLLYLPQSTFFKQVFNIDYREGFVFLANLLGSLVTFAVFLPYIFKFKYRFNGNLLREQLTYAFPLIFVGLAGMVNETLDRALLKKLLPFSEQVNLAQTGIYGACYKLSILMTLFVQAYRMAAEPFFFTESKEKNAKEVYAVTMNYFIAVCAFIFIGVMTNMEWLKFFIDKKFHEGLFIVPILLMANMCLGIYYNLSIWYKLSDRTMMGAYVSIVGAIITIALNIYWIPRIGYAGSAWATFICYASMMVISYLLGQKYYPVNYNIIKYCLYTVLAIAIWFLHNLFITPLYMNHLAIYMALNLFIMAGFASFIYLLEFRKTFGFIRSSV